ncbi:MAG: FAD-dependent oxidoreductase [Candidatus Eisenbacteria bacterium]
MSLSFYARLKRKHTPVDELVSRRTFLRQMTLASGALLLSSCGPGWSRGGRGDRPRVLVAGAGFAGLAAAFELASAGYDVVILESRKRAGGRVLSFTDFPNGRVVEGGAELVGSNHPMWMSYADRFGLTFLDLSADEDLNEPFLLHDRVLDPSEVEGLYEEMDAAAAALTRDAASVDADRPWLSPDARELDARTTRQWLDGLSLSELGRYAAGTELMHNNGVPLEQQSYLGNLAQVKGGGLEAYWTESEVYRCAGGNQQLAYRLAEAIGSDRIHLDDPIVRVTTTDAGVSVRTASGQLHEGDDLVFTVPPPCGPRSR